MLKNKISISDEEELRIVYVGITRPRRLLVLAVPDEENKAAWEARLFGQQKRNNRCICNRLKYGQPTNQAGAKSRAAD